MKKRFLKFTSIVLAMCSLTGMSACINIDDDGATKFDKVYLQAITGPEAVGVVEADYFLLAEPAVSAQRQKGFTIKGNLQALYGGEQGYPQAVLVAKNEIVETYAEWTASFVSKVQAAGGWLQTASGEEIVAAVSAHLEDQDTTTALKAPLLSSEVLVRCSVRFSYASESKTEVTDFLTQMLAVNDKAAAIPTDGFYWSGSASSEGETVVSGRELSVYMPDGAPALAMAQLMSEDTADDGVTYNVVSSSLIASKVTNKDADKNADLCVLPLTAASKLLGSGDNYKMLGVVTHGNLYLISKDGEAVTAKNIGGLKGKKIGVLQINEVPGLTLKTVLNKYEIPFEEVKALS